MDLKKNLPALSNDSERCRTKVGWTALLISISVVKLKSLYSYLLNLSKASKDQQIAHEQVKIKREATEFVLVPTVLLA